MSSGFPRSPYERAVRGRDVLIRKEHKREERASCTGPADEIF